MKYYSVTFWEAAGWEMEPWTSVFNSREKAEEFAEKANRIIEEKGLDAIRVTIDSGDINGDSYLDWLRGNE